jgi:hypothetical protein
MARFILALGVLGVVLASAPMARADDTFQARLTGDEEVPPVVTETSGKLKMQVNKDETAVDFVLTVNDGVAITQAHLHCGVFGMNGPIFVFLGGLHAAGLDVDGKWINNATFTDASITNRGTPCGADLRALLQAMRNGMVYANVHSVQFPGGVVRGQVELAGE